MDPLERHAHVEQLVSDAPLRGDEGMDPRTALSKARLFRWFTITPARWPRPSTSALLQRRLPDTLSESSRINISRMIVYCA